MSPNDPTKSYPDWREERRRRWEERRQRRMARFAHRGFAMEHGPGFRVVIGSIVLLLGLLFLLENLGIVYVEQVWQFWPVIFIAMGIAHVIDGRGWHSRLWGGGMAAIGLLFLAQSLGYLPWNVWGLLWPVLLIFWGIVILLRGFGAGAPWAGPSPFVHDVSASSEDVLNAVAVFGGIERRVQSQNFQGGEASAVFGGVEIDLRGAATTRDEMLLQANAIFGGVELTVPDTWDVVVRGAGVLGGYEDKTHRAPTPDGVKRPRLVIEGSAVFGGVSVKS